jgi:penicillin-binding protein 1A
MKPFVYSLAMSEGFSPCQTILNVQPHIFVGEGQPLWRPRNASSSRIGEYVTIEWGLQQSSNWITAHLMNQLSPFQLERLLRSYGFKGFIDPVIAMCLGTPDISIAEMASAYTTFVNKGLRVDPLYVSHIEDAFGNTVATFQVVPHEVLGEDAAYKILHMLQSVVEGGTAGRLRSTYGLRGDLGGKTGTTQNQSDAWYMGVSPHLVAGCWVGGDEPSIHFDSMEGQGARVAMPIYGIFMRKVYADRELAALGYSDKETFDIPASYKAPCGQRTTGRELNSSARSRTVTGFDEFFD